MLFPFVIFGIGLFQYVLRKWILPVDKYIIFELEDQFPSQGIIFHPGFGSFIIIAGFIMLVLLNLVIFLKLGIGGSYVIQAKYGAAYNDCW